MTRMMMTRIPMMVQMIPLFMIEFYPSPAALHSSSRVTTVADVHASGVRERYCRGVPPREERRRSQHG